MIRLPQRNDYVLGQKGVKVANKRHGTRDDGAGRVCTARHIYLFNTSNKDRGNSFNPACLSDREHFIFIIVLNVTVTLHLIQLCGKKLDSECLIEKH